MTFESKFNPCDKLYAVVLFDDQSVLSSDYIVFHGTVRAVAAVSSVSEGKLASVVTYTFDNLDTPTGCDLKGHMTYADPCVIEDRCFETKEEAMAYMAENGLKLLDI